MTYDGKMDISGRNIYIIKLLVVIELYNMFALYCVKTLNDFVNQYLQSNALSVGSDTF